MNRTTAKAKARAAALAMLALALPQGGRAQEQPPSLDLPSGVNRDAQLSQPEAASPSPTRPVTVPQRPTRVDPTLGIPDIDYSIDGSRRQPRAAPQPAPAQAAPPRQAQPTEAQIRAAREAQIRAAREAAATAQAERQQGAPPAASLPPGVQQQRELAEFVYGPAPEVEANDDVAAAPQQAAPVTGDAAPDAAPGAVPTEVDAEPGLPTAAILAALVAALAGLGFWMLRRRRKSAPDKAVVEDEQPAAQILPPEPETDTTPALEPAVASEPSPLPEALRAPEPQPAFTADAPSKPAFSVPIARIAEAHMPRRDPPPAPARSKPIAPAGAPQRFDALGLPIAAPRAPAASKPKARIQRYDALGLPLRD